MKTRMIAVFRGKGLDVRFQQSIVTVGTRVEIGMEPGGIVVMAMTHPTGVTTVSIPEGSTLSVGGH